MMKNLLYLIMTISSFYAFSQQRQRDTLFIEYDSSLLIKDTDLTGGYDYYLIRGTESQDEVTYFEEEKVLMNLKPKKIFTLKDILRKSNAYYEKDKIRIDRLLDYLGWDIIFLVKNDKFIQVAVVQEIG